jgi:hypothetical protein
MWRNFVIFRKINWENFGFFFLLVRIIIFFLFFFWLNLHENQDKLTHEKLKHNPNYGKKNLRKKHTY